MSCIFRYSCGLFCEITLNEIIHSQHSTRCLQRNTWLCVHWHYINWLNTQEWRTMDTQPSPLAFITHAKLKLHKIYPFIWWNMSNVYLFSLHSSVFTLQFVSYRLIKLGETTRYYWSAAIRLGKIIVKQVMKWSLWIHQVIAVVAPLWCHTLG